MKKLNVFSIGLLFLVGFLASCTHSKIDSTSYIPYVNGNNTGNGNNNGNTNPNDPNLVYFSKDILPILNSNCAMSGCHDGATAKEGIILNSYDNVIRTSKVLAYNPFQSKIYQAVTTTNPKDVMPQAPKPRLTNAQIDLIAKWINQGAKNLTYIYVNVDTTNVTYSGVVSKIINNNCVGCHNGAIAGGGINLSGYAGVAAIAASGRLVGATTAGTMPKGSFLDAGSIKQLQIWVKNGYLNN